MFKPKIGIVASSLFTNRIFINYELTDEFLLMSNWDKESFECANFDSLEYFSKQSHKVARLKWLNDQWYQHNYPSCSKRIMDIYFHKPKKYNSYPPVWNPNLIKKIIQKLTKSKATENKLKQLGIDTLVCMNPYAAQEALYATNAKRLGIKVIAYVTSWDNISTKTALPFDPDAIIVWSDMLRRHVRTYCPYWDHIPVEIAGAPQYDHFKDESLLIPKVDFMKQQKLNLKLPIVLYTLGSPNFLLEEFEILHKYCKQIQDSGLINSFNLVIRLHPDKSSEKYIKTENLQHTNIHIQARFNSQNGARFQSKEDISEWVNTFTHADLLINAGSTTLIDGSVAGIPHINIASACKKKGNQAFYDVIMNFHHLKELHNEGLILNVFSIEQLVSMTISFLKDQAFPDSTKALWEKVIQIEPGKSRETLLSKIRLLAYA